LQAHPVRRLKAAILPASTVVALAAAAPAKSPDANGPGMGKPGTPEDFARRAAEVMQKADKDGNGKLSVAEIAAALGNRLPAEEIEKIVVQFDRDGDKQLNLAEAAAVLQVFGKR
jgi:hypothetical protein